MMNSATTALLWGPSKEMRLLKLKTTKLQTIAPKSQSLYKISNGTQLSRLGPKSHTENSISFPSLWEPP